MSRRAIIKRAKIRRGRRLEMMRHWWKTKTAEEIMQDIVAAYKAYLPPSYAIEVERWQAMTEEQRAARLSPKITISIPPEYLQ